MNDSFPPRPAGAPMLLLDEFDGEARVANVYERMI